MSRTEHPTDSPFPTTRWTLVRMAERDDDESASAALESLCRDYWAPLHAFARHFGQSESDSADTVQDFRSGFVASGGFARASRPKGRLRTYLLGSLRHFMTDQWCRSPVPPTHFKPSENPSIPGSRPALDSRLEASSSCRH